MRTSPSWLLMSAVACALMVSASADAGFVVGDGTLSDWGIVVADGTSGHTGAAGVNVGTNWGDIFATRFPAVLPNSPPGVVNGSYFSLAGGLTVQYALEDSNDGWEQGQGLGPDGGGQDYDAEFMGVAMDSVNDIMYIAIVTGQRPDNGRTLYSPGDIIIRPPTPATTPSYGIEIGGASGHSSTDLLPIDENAAGTTYTIDGSGHTLTGVTGVLTEGLREAGDIVQFTNSSQYITETINAHSVVQIANGFNGIIGAASDFYFSLDSLAGSNQHAIIEMAIPFAQFGITNFNNFNGWQFSWAPSCGNDVTPLSITFSDNLTSTPEPTSMLLTGLGALGFIGVRRRMRTKVAA